MNKQQKEISGKALPLPYATIIELPLKLRNELRLERKVRSIFKTMGDINQIEMASFRSIPDFTAFSNDISQIIEADSLITAKSFKKNLRKKFNLGNVEAARINKEIENYIAQSSAKQARHIVNTTNKEIEKLTARAIQQSAIDGVELTDEQLAKKVTAGFRKKNRNRSKVIATTEVQRVAEQSKFIEADILNRSGHITPPEKRWDAILDQKTRDKHAEADGQRQPMNEPFVVNGELLMHPGDTRLGASAGNVINCRCSVQYNTEKI